MSIISAEIVEATWRDVGALEPRAARALMEEAAERQPALLAYVMASTEGSSGAAQGLAVYLYYVLLQMFERAGGAPLRPVSMSRVDHHRKRNTTLLDRLAVADERFWERAATVESSAQPFVARYVVEALFEEEHSDEMERPSSEETGLLYLTLKTVVDVLDEALGAAQGDAT